MVNEGNNNIIVPTSAQAREYGRKGGIKSAKSRRHKRKLADRIKLALEISTQQNLNGLKKSIRELLPNRHRTGNKEDLKLLIAQAKTVKECGIDLYQIISLTENAVVDVSDKLKAIGMIWDREEGKAVNKTENKEVKEFSDKIDYID